VAQEGGLVRPDSAGRGQGRGQGAQLLDQRRAAELRGRRLGEYLRALGDDVAGQEIRAMVPVNLRPLDQAHKLGNRFGLVPLVLPIGVDNPIERVYEVRRRMAALKGSYQPLLAFSLLAVAGLLIKPAQDVMLNLFAKKTTAVMTNVPGPREKLKFWAPRWSKACSGCRSRATWAWACPS
jgi:hypothetical protein